MLRMFLVANLQIYKICYLIYLYIEFKKNAHQFELNITTNTLFSKKTNFVVSLYCEQPIKILSAQRIHKIKNRRTTGKKHKNRRTTVTPTVRILHRIHTMHTTHTKIIRIHILIGNREILLFVYNTPSEALNFLFFLKN
jgi:hypothetical protein